MATMSAVRIHNYGGRDQLSFELVPCPDVGNDEVLVRVFASSVNPFDWAVRNGYLVSYYTYALPMILGLDVSGVVEALGPDVQGIAVGDAVYARSLPSKNGAYASYISLPASLVAPKPQSLDHIQAAAVPHAAFSAWEAIIKEGNVTSRQTVLIHGAAGGVGTFAVQLAKLQGAHVIGTCSSQNQEYLKSIGADEVIDHNSTRFEEVVKDMDVVIDLVGDMPDNTLQRSWQVLKPGGILASLVQPPLPEAASDRHVQGKFVNSESCNGKTLTEIGSLIDEGRLHPVVSTVYPLQDIRLAHEQSESRHVRGKIVLQIGDL